MQATPAKVNASSRWMLPAFWFSQNRFQNREFSDLLLTSIFREVVDGLGVAHMQKETLKWKTAPVPFQLRIAALGGLAMEIKPKTPGSSISKALESTRASRTMTQAPNAPEVLSVNITLNLSEPLEPGELAEVMTVLLQLIGSKSLVPLRANSKQLGSDVPSPKLRVRNKRQNPTRGWWSFGRCATTVAESYLK